MLKNKNASIYCAERYRKFRFFEDLGYQNLGPFIGVYTKNAGKRQDWHQIRNNIKYTEKHCMCA